MKCYKDNRTCVVIWEQRTFLRIMLTDMCIKNAKYMNAKANNNKRLRNKDLDECTIIL